MSCAGTALETMLGLLLDYELGRSRTRICWMDIVKVGSQNGEMDGIFKKMAMFGYLINPSRRGANAYR